LQRQALRLDAQCAAVRHGIPGIERQVEQGVFHLAGVDQGEPGGLVDGQLEADGFAQAALQQLGKRADQRIDRGRPGLQRLAAGEGQQALGQGGGALRRAMCRIEIPRQVVMATGIQAQANQIQRTDDASQHVVEVVCDAAGKLADGVHLLRVAQLFLCSAALLDFDGQLVERLLQCLGSQLDLLLELLIELAQHLLAAPLGIDVDDHYRRAHRLLGVVIEGHAAQAQPAFAAVFGVVPVVLVIYLLAAQGTGTDVLARRYDLPVAVQAYPAPSPVGRRRRYLPVRHVLVVLGVAEQRIAVGIDEADPDWKVLDQSLEAGSLIDLCGLLSLPGEPLPMQLYAGGEAAEQRGGPDRLFEYHEVVDRRRQAGLERGMGFGVAAQENERDGTAGWQPLERGADLIQRPRRQLVGEHHDVDRFVDALCQARLVSAKADAVALGGQQRGELAPFVAVAHAENDSLCFRSFACHL